MPIQLSEELVWWGGFKPVCRVELDIVRTPVNVGIVHDTLRTHTHTHTHTHTQSQVTDLRSRTQSLQKEKDELTEANKERKSSLETMEARLQEADKENLR